MNRQATVQIEGETNDWKDGHTDKQKLKRETDRQNRWWTNR